MAIYEKEEWELRGDAFKDIPKQLNKLDTNRHLKEKPWIRENYSNLPHPPFGKYRTPSSPCLPSLTAAAAEIKLRKISSSEHEEENLLTLGRRTDVMRPNEYDRWEEDAHDFEDGRDNTRVTPGSFQYYSSFDASQPYKSGLFSSAYHPFSQNSKSHIKSTPWREKQQLSGEHTYDRWGKNLDNLHLKDQLPIDYGLFAYKPWILPLATLYEELFDELVDTMCLEVVQELANDYWVLRYVRRDMAEILLTQTLDELTVENCHDVVQQTLREISAEYLDTQLMKRIFMDLVTEIMKEMGPDLLSEAVHDVTTAQFLEKEIFCPTVSELLREIFQEILENYEARILEKQLNDVSQRARDVVVDSMCLDYLLELVARQGQLWTETDCTNKYLDGLTLDVLLDQYLLVNNFRYKTRSYSPFKKLHEKVVTDVALDVLLKQLSASLIEDLGDLDEYERGLLSL